MEVHFWAEVHSSVKDQFLAKVQLSVEGPLCIILLFIIIYSAEDQFSAEDQCWAEVQFWAEV